MKMSKLSYKLFAIFGDFGDFGTLYLWNLKKVAILILVIPTLEMMPFFKIIISWPFLPLQWTQLHYNYGRHKYKHFHNM